MQIEEFPLQNPSSMNKEEQSDEGQINVSHIMKKCKLNTMSIPAVLTSNS